MQNNLGHKNKNTRILSYQTLKARRIFLNISKEELANNLDLNQDYIEQYENRADEIIETKFIDWIKKIFLIF